MSTTTQPTIEKGFYWHFKHDPNGPVNHYTYKVLGVAKHTETGVCMVIYKPLYDESAFLGSEANLNARPVEMFLSKANLHGASVERFTKIIDEKIIATLEQIEKTLN